MPDTPHRVQLRRTKGWQMPENTVSVARPTRWGNAVRIGQPLVILDPTDGSTTTRPASPREVVSLYRTGLKIALVRDAGARTALRQLRGKSLACWCRLCAVHQAGKPLGVACLDCAPCHADALLELANGPVCEAVDA